MSAEIAYEVITLFRTRDHEQILSHLKTSWKSNKIIVDIAKNKNEKNNEPKKCRWKKQFYDKWQSHNGKVLCSDTFEYAN